MNGRIALNVEDWPILGEPGATSVVAYLFDYTCPTCRKGHRKLVEALKLCGPDVAVVLVPAPVDPTCNPHVTRKVATHAFACRFARLGLELWRRNPNVFVTYDQWVFEPEEPPAIGLARAFAQQLTGLTDIDPSIPDEDLDRLIATGVATYRASGADGMPTLLFRNAVLRGELPKAGELARIIQEQCGIQLDAEARVLKL
jgi:protein-disulfide isomerase